MRLLQKFSEPCQDRPKTPARPSLLRASGSCFLKRERQRYLLSFDRRLEMPSVSSARRSAVGSVDMRAENQSQPAGRSKNKDNFRVCSGFFKNKEGEKFWRRGDQISCNFIFLLLSGFSSLPVRKMHEISKKTIHLPLENCNLKFGI